MGAPSLKFSNNIDKEFVQILKNRVNNYMAEHGIPKHADTEMLLKTVFVFLLFLVPYLSMILLQISDFWTLVILWSLIGISHGAIGLSVMHDSIHGAYSPKRKINDLMSLSLNIIGGNVYVWFMQHNVLHHTYTNVDEHDDDLDIPFLLRMSPHQPKHWFHKYQHLYVWFLYALASLFWVVSKDFVQLNKYKKKGLIDTQKEYVKHLGNIVFWKVIYYSYILIIPIVFLPVEWPTVLLMFLFMHLACGLLLSIIFQPAHVFPSSEFLENTPPTLKNNFIVHQFLTTTNFKINNPLINWLAGGLNYQVEHHLFPQVCHVHYRKISPIVKKTAEEFGIPYFQEPSMLRAAYNHTLMLKNIGRMPSSS